MIKDMICLLTNSCKYDHEPFGFRLYLLMSMTLLGL